MYNYIILFIYLLIFIYKFFNLIFFVCMIRKRRFDDKTKWTKVFHKNADFGTRLEGQVLAIFTKFEDDSVMIKKIKKFSTVSSQFRQKRQRGDETFLKNIFIHFFKI